MVILHIPVCFDNLPRIGASRRQYEIDCLEFNLLRLQQDPVQIYVSINGSSTPYYTDQIAKLQESIKFTVFHRPNIGYQWGGYYDTWLKTKHLKADYYGTLEVDICFYEKWHSALQGHHIGMSPLKGVAAHDMFWDSVTGKHDLKKVPGFKQGSMHTRGGFHFCSHELLTKIDNKFHQFTFAKGHDHFIDGIVHGEVLFCHKIRAVGYELVDRKMATSVSFMKQPIVPQQHYNIKPGMSTWNDMPRTYKDAYRRQAESDYSLGGQAKYKGKMATYIEPGDHPAGSSPSDKLHQQQWQAARIKKQRGTKCKQNSRNGHRWKN